MKSRVKMATCTYILRTYIMYNNSLHKTELQFTVSRVLTRCTPRKGNIRIQYMFIVQSVNYIPMFSWLLINYTFRLVFSFVMAFLVHVYLISQTGNLFQKNCYFQIQINPFTETTLYFMHSGLFTYTVFRLNCLPLCTS